MSLTLSQTTHCPSSKLQEFADDNFKFNENGRKFSKGKGLEKKTDGVIITLSAEPNSSVDSVADLRT